MLKVLIVDDEKNVCKLIANLIDWSALGMEIVGMAHDGIQALDSIERFRPNIVITDIRMPGSDGIELLRKARELGAESEFIIISGHKHFEYAQNAIKYGVGDYLLKPVNGEDLSRTLIKVNERIAAKQKQRMQSEQLQHKLDHDLRKKKAEFLEILYSGGTAKGTGKANETYGYRFMDACFQAFIVKMDGIPGPAFENAMGVLLERAEGILTKELSRLCFDMGMYRKDSAMVCVINFGEDKRKEVRKAVKRALDELLLQREIYCDLNITVASGMIVGDVQELPISVEMAKYLVALRRVVGINRFIENEEGMNYAKNVEEEALKGLRKTLQESVERLDEAAVRDVLDETGKLCRKENLDGFAIKHVAEELCRTFVRGCYALQDDYEQELKIYSRLTRGMEYCGTLNDLVAYQKQSYGKTIKELRDKQEQAVIRPIREAQGYIAEHFAEQITLEAISSMIGFSPTYFSTLFKKETGENFLEYLTGVRVDNAKELLREGDGKIEDIARQVGYSDVKHFKKTFAKLTKLKPVEYRKLYSK